MTALGCVLLICSDHLDPAQPGFVFKHVRDPCVRPVVQSLIQPLSTIDQIADPIQVTHCDHIHARFITTLNEIPGDDMKKVVNLSLLLPIDLTIASALPGVVFIGRLYASPYLLPIPADRLDFPPAVQQRRAVIEQVLSITVKVAQEIGSS